MKSLSDLLSKYKDLIPTDSLIKEAVVEVMDKMFDVKLDKKDITVSRGVIYLKTSNTVKMEILIHKREIMKKLEEILVKNPPKDIR